MATLPLKPATIALEIGHQRLSKMFFFGGWLGYIGDEILPSYIRIIISQYKDPYKAHRITLIKKHLETKHLRSSPHPRCWDVCGACFEKDGHLSRGVHDSKGSVREMSAIYTSCEL